MFCSEAGRVTGGVDWRRIGALLALLTLLGAGGCTTSTTVPSNSTTIQVIQQQGHLSVPAGQSASATISCAAGQTLVSGGYYGKPTLNYGDIAVTDSYPSDSAGNAPTTQGQVEDSWTVHARNSTSSGVSYLITATCIAGIPVKTGVWFQSYVQKDLSGDDSLVSMQCPNPKQTALTGGGFQSALNGFNPDAVHGIISAYPSEQNGINHQWWNLIGFGISGVSYAVCAQGVDAAPEVSVTDASPNMFKEDTVSCPANEALSGGGFLQDGDKGGGSPVTVNTSGIPDLTTWHAGYDTTNNGSILYVDGICIQAHLNLNIITTEAVRHLIRIPADTIVVATDGSGQVRAALEQVGVTQAQTSPLPAVPSTNPFTGSPVYTVPARCGDPTPAIDTATAALTAQLRSQLAAGQVAFGTPSVTISRGSLTCSPAAGTQRSMPFTYTQAIDGTASQGTYSPADVRAYQGQQLHLMIGQLGGQYMLDAPVLCPEGIRIQSAGSSRATLACPAGGIVEWQWSAPALAALARSLAGKTTSAALQLMDATPGMQPGTSTINLPNGATLPTDPTRIEIALIPPYVSTLLHGFA